MLTDAQVQEFELLDATFPDQCSLISASPCVIRLKSDNFSLNLIYPPGFGMDLSSNSS